ncbi:MAG: copper-binding protein [Polyangiaceae bacterium]
MSLRNSAARHLGWIAPAAMLLFLASSAMCAAAPEASSAASPSAAASYSATGVVKSIDTSDKSILIKHEDIPGFMKAMTMLFELRDLDQVKGIAAGDGVKFTFTDEGNGRLVIQTIAKNP